ncbi:methylthioribulose 1-phosphate dehydratase [Methylovulum psychrotolerans]|jgi:methylthioribulose-1-phosphate dehydratase|uniref:Methylthioribulose-1-phosphate dehydratase n=1 Tax=Methylovulum psychrotolerans TaxID=1704499 RepID=A0A1Z4C409_9GAMM|nr:methylthioribulose 1-phosphate dehydratase [Methylovulum psychrotolerans]ASF48214.1 methylthioribulose-1-phosphate dehydratase [Methylovulum psychrotolerans]MBT9100064.1 methylthioribulose 1-phosphate dehydratase [Methylovulum psychrotolerans]
MTATSTFYQAAQQLIAAGCFIDGKGWVPATSGNFSARLADGSIAITVSGKHKGYLQVDDIMLIDSEANSLDGKKPSAETGLHTALYRRFPDIHAVLHPHPLNAVLVSRLFGDEIVLENYELLKAFRGITTHASRVVIPIFANDQDISRLAAQADAYLDAHPDCQAYIIAGHGLYVWGVDVNEALRYLEAVDFLLACELALRLHRAV